MKNNQKNIKNNLKNNIESSHGEVSSNNKINVYKNTVSGELELDDINNINIIPELEDINIEENNEKLILSSNKSKKITQNKNNQTQFPANKQVSTGKIFFRNNNSQYPSIYLKNLKIKRLKLKKKNEKFNQNTLSSNRALNISEKDNEDEREKNKANYNNENEENYQAYRSEERFIENIDDETKIIPEKLFQKIISLNLDVKITNEELKFFFFNPIPKDETFVSNININYPGKNMNNIFNYDLEILNNNKIFYFAKIIKYFPTMEVKIYFSENYNNINNNNFSKSSSFENENNISHSELIYVGKIISNMMRTNFVVYSENKVNDYIKILEINYAINIFGLLGIREMKVNKYINNNISFSLCNSKPEFDYQYNNYIMDFNGRVKQLSKKNFILVNDSNIKDSNKYINENNKSINILQCGKIDEKTYALDFISPLSPFEAFCISITSLITKISCE